MIAPGQLAQMQRAAAVLMATPATVQRYQTVWQTVSAVGLTCHVLPTTQRYQLIVGARMADATAWTLLFPQGTDAHPADRVLALDVAYSVLEVQEPRSLDLMVRTLCLPLGPLGGDGTGTPTYLQPNATVTISRRGGLVPAGGTNRRVRLDDPSPQERLLPEGAQTAMLLYDAPDADYRLADVVQIVQVDGHSGPPAPNRYSVGEVGLIPAPWPLTRVQLTATSR